MEVPLWQLASSSASSSATTMSPDTDSTADQPWAFATTGRGRRASKGQPTSLAERIIAVCDDRILTVPTEAQYPRDARKQIRSALSTMPRSTFQKLPHRRLIPLLDAIAGLLVSRPKWEVVGVAFVPDPEKKKTKFVFACNRSPDNLAAGMKHFREIWGLLKAIRKADEDRDTRESTPDEIDLPVEPTESILYKCYNFSNERVKRHFDRATELNMLSALVEARDHQSTIVVDDEDFDQMTTDAPEPEPGSASLPKVNETQFKLITSLITVLEAYVGYAFHGGQLVDFMEACSTANSVLSHELNGDAAFLDDIRKFSFLSL